MLVLARRVNQSIVIGDEIEVVVVDIKGDQIKLGIRAPRNVSVHRSEVYRDIQEQNLQAAQSKPDALKGLKDFLPRKKKE